MVVVVVAVVGTLDEVAGLGAGSRCRVSWQATGAIAMVQYQARYQRPRWREIGSIAAIIARWSMALPSSDGGKRRRRDRCRGRRQRTTNSPTRPRLRERPRLRLAVATTAFGF